MPTFQPRLDILPAPQRTLWPELDATRIISRRTVARRSHCGWGIGSRSILISSHVSRSIPPH